MLILRVTLLGGGAFETGAGETVTLPTPKVRALCAYLAFTAGRVQVRDVREAQDQLITSKNGLTQTITAYLQARLQLLLDLGMLSTEGSKFWLKDPLASRLTPDMRGPGPLQMPDNELIPPDRFLEPQP